MGKALEVIGFRATNPGAGGAAATVNTGDTFAVRSHDFAAGCWLENAWYQGATLGFLRFTSPRLHDNVQGLRLQAPAAQPVPLLPAEVDQRLYPQDVLNVLIAGGGAEIDAGAYVVYYPDLPGIAARLSTWDEIRPRVEQIMSIPQLLTTGATGGDWGGAQTLVADFDLLKANTDYAILGYTTDIPVAAVGIKGPDTGNLRVGGPGSSLPLVTRDWFVQLSKATGMGHIPVINASNRLATLVDVMAVATATAVNVSIVCAQLSQ